jgi:hypothetical protein
MTDPGVEVTPGVARFRSRRSTADLERSLARDGWSVRVVDLTAAVGKRDLLEALAAALGFPQWVGRNWDALDDAMRDLSWLPSGIRGRAIVMRGAGGFERRSPGDAKVLRDVLEHAAQRWAETGSPLAVLLRR